MNHVNMRLYLAGIPYTEGLATQLVSSITAVVLSGLLGEVVARLFSEPMNRVIRQRLCDGPERLGSVIRSQIAD